MDWRPIETVPDGDNDRVLVYSPEWGVCEARASKDGRYCDPVYWEWFYEGATHWMPLPAPPVDQRQKDDGSGKQHRE
jgi:hypothetical protein